MESEVRSQCYLFSPGACLFPRQVINSNTSVRKEPCMPRTRDEGDGFEIDRRVSAAKVQVEHSVSAQRCQLIPPQKSRMPRAHECAMWRTYNLILSTEAKSRISARMGSGCETSPFCILPTSFRDRSMQADQPIRHKVITFRATSEFAENIRRAAKHEDRSVSNYIRIQLSRAIEQKPGRDRRNAVK